MPTSDPDNSAVPPDKQARRRAIALGLNELIAVCACIVSALSMAVAYDESRATKKLVQASSFPYLEFQSTYNRGPDGRWQSIQQSIENDGVGPADVRSARMTLDGRPVASVEQVLRACCGVTQPKSTATLVDRMIRPGTTINYFSVDAKSGDADGTDRFIRLLQARRVVVSVCYCSVFNECWQLRTESFDRPAPVGQCPPRSPDLDI